MIKKMYTLLTIMLLLSTLINAHNTEKCGAVSIEKAAIAKDPSILQRILDLELKTSDFIQNMPARRNSIVYSIPVVIHVIHNGEPIGTGTNISEAKILLQIQRLNEDFRKMNTDALISTHPFYPVQADCEIEFCLAKRDPLGNPTTGILRYNKGQNSWDMPTIDAIIKPATIWNRNNYMNIWSINIQDPDAPGVDGFGTFPGSTTDTTDGVVIANWVFGDNSGDKTIVGTHEVGHYLNLRHVWGDNQPDCGDDLVSDTPPSAAPNEGCPTFPHNPNSICGTNANGEMFMNFMDYSDAACTVMFTYGQKDRMIAALSIERASLTTSNACTPVTYTITASAGSNGTISPTGAVSVSNGVNQTFTITPNTCYKIDSVLVDGVNNAAAVTSGTYTFSNVTATHAIRAVFKLKTNAITVTQTANGTISPATTTVNCGSNQTFTITPSACYNIATVLVDGVNNPAAVTSGTYTFTNVIAAHTITATYVLKTNAITVTQTANGTISPATTSVNCGANQTFTITPSACYNIATVLVDGVNNPAAVTSGTYTFTNVTTTHTISATYVLKTNTITASAGANGTISPNGATIVNCGANQIYTITPNGGFNVLNVLVDGVSQGAITTYTFSNVTAAHTISVTFVSGAYTITASAGANGIISPSGAVSVGSGANQTFTITPNACYNRATVLVDGVNNAAAVTSGTYTFTNVTTAHTISATFVVKTNAITVSQTANGTISPATTTVNCGSNQTFTITPSACYKIATVLVDGVNNPAAVTSGTYTFTNVIAAHTITATYSTLLPANAGAITGTTPVCQNQNAVTYTVPVIAGATSYIWTLPTGATGTSTTNSIIVNFGATATSGNITVKGNNTCGNGTTSTLAVIVNAKPTTPTATFSVNVLSSSAASGNQWYNQNGIIAGATTQNYTPIINGSYYTIVTLSGCSSDTSNKINVVLTGIHLTRSNQEIKVYPNPVSDQLMIEIKGNNKTINMEVLNAIGQVVYTNTMVDKTTIPTTDFAVGVYIIKLKIEDSFEFIKIIKQ